MLTETAHAKLNLGLAVTARRGDGFHELDTLFARIGLADELSVEATPGSFSLELQVPDDLPGADLLDSSDNLVLRAARSFREAGGTGGASFRLTKRIPLAAGLGGGSSDAAAALRLMARLYPEEALRLDLPALARELGSDVPFFLSGHRAARGRGRGERLDPVEVPQRAVVLANPGVTVSAGEAYGWLQNFSRRQSPEQLVAALAAGQEPRWQNALQAGVTRERKEVRQVIAELRELGLQGVLMSGSGPTCFGLAADIETARLVAQELKARQQGWWVLASEVGV